MAAKVKALQQWCKMQCEGYRDVNVVNMTSSWKSGLAFCAIIHRYRPELIDYDSLSKENVFQNNKLAFEVAQQLGIPALLDAEDMVVMTVPDKLCIITYVSQYYNFFRNYKPAAAPVKRHLPEDTSAASAAKKATVEKPVLEENKSQNAASASSKRSTLEDTCNICQGKVFLMERQIEGKKLYHRHCLRNMQKEQSSTLRTAQHSGDEQKRGLDEFREMKSETMEYDEVHSDVATGEGDCGNAIPQVPVSKLDQTISSGSKKTTVADVSVGATQDSQVTSVAVMNPSTAVTSANKSVVTVTSAIGASSISSVSSSGTFQPKAGGAISSPVVTSVLPSHVPHAEERTYTSDKAMSKPAKPVDASEGTNQLTLVPASHDLQTSVSQTMPVSSNQPTQTLPLTLGSSDLPNKASNSSESPAAQFVQAPLRPKLPPTIIPQQSVANVNVSPSTVVPPKPPRCSVIVETIPVETGKGKDDSLVEMFAPSVSQSLSDHKEVSVASITFQRPDCNIPVCQVGDARSPVQTTTTIHPSQSTSAHINVSSSTLSPKTRPAPNPPEQAVSVHSNPISTSTNLPISNSSSVPISNSSSLPIANSTNLPISTSTNLSTSNSTNLPTSTMTNIPVSTPVSSPVTTLRSIRTSKSHPAPCPPSHSVPFSTTPSVLSLKTNSPSTPSTAALSSPSVSTSESLPSSTSVTPTTASSSSVPKPAMRHHISTPAVHPVSTPEIHPVSTPAIHPVSTPAIHPVSTSAIHPVSTPAIHPVSTPEIHPVSMPAIHPVSTPAIHPVSTPATHPVSAPLQTPSNVLGGNSLGQNPETVVSHGSSSHVTSTQSVKSPISHPGRTPPGRPVLPPSGLPGHIPKASPAACTAPVQSSSTSTSTASAHSMLHPTLTQPSDKSLALPSATPAVPSVYVAPPTGKESSDAVAIISTKETNEQIVSGDTSQNVGQFAGQVNSQSAVQSDVQSSGKHPPIPKRPPSILVSKEIEKCKHLPVKLDNALDRKSIVNPGFEDNQELKENKNPVGNEALVNGATVDPRPESRRSVRANPFNSPEPPSSSVNAEDFHGKVIKDQTAPRISKKETQNKIEDLPKRSTGVGDTNKDVEKIIVKPSPSPRSILKVKSDVPVPSPTQSESHSSIWYVDLELEGLQNESGSAIKESPAVAGTKLVPNELGHGMVEEKANQQKAISVPVPLPRSRSKKGKDDDLPLNGDAVAQSKLISPGSPSAEPSNAIKPSADGMTSSGVMRAAPPRPTPPRPESIKQALKKITPDTTFTFEDQSFNFGPTSGSRKPSDGRELHMRSSAVASNHKQPVVKRKVNAEGRLSAQYITEQLRLLDTTLKTLEKEGRVLEGRIRSGTDESMDDDDKNDLMGQWFEMINHKNDLVRQESELIYRCRQQELEDKHEEVEFELRCLMNKPDHLKTANEKKREEVLLQKLLQTVTQRNNIVESMEEDRIRYLKEDEEIAQMLTTSRFK